MENLHRALGRAHAEIYWRLFAGDGQRGQGTVEYAAIMLLVASVLGFAVTAIQGDANIAEKITKKLTSAIDSIEMQKK
jgi:hypothetical protein